MIVIPPSIRTVDAKQEHHAISFIYEFTADPAGLVYVGTEQLQGVLYTLDIQSLSSARLGAMKSLRFSQSFGSPSGPTDNDGDLYIICGSAEITRIPYPTSATSGATEDFLTLVPVVSGLIPIVSPQYSPIQFIKAARAQVGVIPPVGSGVMEGVLHCTVYDFTLPPYIISGFDYNL